MKPFNVGVIGIGDISDVYIGNLKAYDVVRVVACWRRDLEKARRKAELHGLHLESFEAVTALLAVTMTVVLNPAASPLHPFAGHGTLYHDIGP